MRGMSFVAVTALMYSLLSCENMASGPVDTVIKDSNPRKLLASSRALHMVVSKENHLVEANAGQLVGGSHVRSTQVTGVAYINRNRRIAFRAVLGAKYGTFGWHFARLTPTTLHTWSGDHGNPGAVFFLDSVNGLLDNDGAWKVIERINADGVTDNHVTISPKRDCVTWDPAKVARLNLGPVRKWRVSAEWLTGPDPMRRFPGAIVVFTTPHGGWDFDIVTPEDPRTIMAGNWVYSFFVCDLETGPHSHLRVTWTTI